MEQKRLFETDLCLPILRWAGGKRWLQKSIYDLLINVDYNAYHEPFFGGGAIFFSVIDSKKVYLNDINDDLINFYRVLQSEPEELYRIFSTFTQNEQTYYSLRQQMFEDSNYQAARFLYLNKTCFNGLYRVNSKGEFNVPYGRKSYDLQIVHEGITRCSSKIKGSSLSVGDFYTTIDDISNGDLVFVDPPYTVTHNNNGFVQYNEKIFSLEDQYRLATYLKEVNSRGAFFILTNANHSSIREIFHDCGNFIEVERNSLISGDKSKRGKYQELLITNI